MTTPPTAPPSPFASLPATPASPPAVPPSRVVIVTISSGRPHLPFVSSIIECERAGYQAIIKSSHAYLDVERNTVLRRALNTVDEYTNTPSFDWLVFVDDDIQFTPEDIRRVTSHDPARFPVVTGLYANNFADQPDVGLAPLVYRYTYNPATQSQSFRNMTNTEFWSSRRTPSQTPTGQVDLIEVDGAGAGFLAMHRSVLDKMYQTYQLTPGAQPWFAEVEIGNTWTGEDLTFCYRTKALGFPVMADPTVRVLHYKMTTYSVPVLEFSHA